MCLLETPPLRREWGLPLSREIPPRALISRATPLCGVERGPEIEDTAHPNPTPAPLARVHMEGKSASSGSIWRGSQCPRGRVWISLGNLAELRGFVSPTRGQRKSLVTLVVVARVSSTTFHRATRFQKSTNQFHKRSGVFQARNGHHIDLSLHSPAWAAATPSQPALCTPQQLRFQVCSLPLSF